LNAGGPAGAQKKQKGKIFLLPIQPFLVPETFLSVCRSFIILSIPNDWKYQKINKENKQ